VEKVSFPYRSKGHLQLLHVVAESGAWERQGLEVEYDRPINAREAHNRVMSGDVDFVGGNHISPYGHRARGDRWVYLGQTVNVVPGRKLVVRADSGINGIADLREKVVGSRGHHPQLNDWLQLKQHGLDVDRDEVSIVGQYGGNALKQEHLEDADPHAPERADALWELVRDRKVDAAFLPVPEPLFAERAGLRLIDVPEFPMIYFSTVSTSLHFLEEHPDLVERFLKGLIEGIHFFKTQPERTAEILRRRFDSKSGTLDDAMARRAQAALAVALEPKLYPTSAAIANVYTLGVRQDDDAAKINPMALWDLHALRRIDDSGFIDDLYREPAAVGG
jgi:ABC-type nitrate/sulfonate/bicarbonate transport system substrate-binding protein